MLPISFFCCMRRQAANSLCKNPGGGIRTKAREKNECATQRKTIWGGKHGWTEALYHLRGAVHADFDQLHRSRRLVGRSRSDFDRAWTDAGQSRLSALVISVALRSVAAADGDRGGSLRRENGRRPWHGRLVAGDDLHRA